MRGLRRHKLTAVGVWLLISAGAAAWIWRLPSVYQAEALVLVESHRLPEQWVPVGSDTDLEARLEAARQKVFASTELEAAILKLGLHAGQRQQLATLDSLVARTRQNLAITPVDSTNRGRLGPFRITFRWHNALVAAQVANHVARRFAEEASQARRSSSGAAAQFLSGQAVWVRRELDQREAALLEYRLRYSEELPELSETLRASTRRLRAELRSLQEETLELARERDTLLQAERAAAPEETASFKPEPAAPGAVVANGATPRKPSQGEELRKRLTSLLASYKPEHPDVRRLVAEVAQAQALETEQAARSQVEPARVMPSPEVPPLPEKPQGSLARRKEIEDRLEVLAARRTQVAAELGLAEQRLLRVPLRQQELATLTREQAFFNDQFRAVAARQQSAQMAVALERSYPSERITLLDQARPPRKPLGHGRWWMMSLASLGGLVIGGLLAIARSCAPAAMGGLESAEHAEVDAEGHGVAGPADWITPAGATKPSGYRMVRSG